MRSRTVGLILLLLPVALFLNLPSASSQSSWQMVSSPTTNNLNSVFMLTLSNGWAVGEHGTILHYDGSSWSTVTSPTGNNLQSVFMLNSNDGWAVGNAGTILHWAGSAWSTVTSPTARNLYSIFILNYNPDGAMIVGASGTVLFWSGASWHVQAPQTANDLFSAFMFSPSDAYVVGDNGTFLSWNGTLPWTNLNSDNVTLNTLRSIQFGGFVDGYAVGSTGTIVHLQDDNPLDVVSTLSVNDLASVFMLGTNDGWAVGQTGTILHFLGSTWDPVPSPAGVVNLRSIFMDNPDEGWIVGDNGVILHYGTADFGIVMSSSSVSIAPGGSGTIGIILASLNGFTGPVTLSAPGFVPTGVTFAINPNPVSVSLSGPALADLTIHVASTTPLGTSPMTVVGTTANVTHGATFNLVVTTATSTQTVTGTSITSSTTHSTTTSSASNLAPPDFTISSSVSSMEFFRGSSNSVTIYLAGENGFSSAVGLSTSWVGAAPSGVDVAFTTPLTPPATTPLVVASTGSAATGTFTLRVTGTSGLLAHHVSPDITVQISAPPTSTSPSGAPLCLIATATYGSELAPEVQLLRNFRDGSIMKTRAGASFMLAFNAWYYSFSPYVASYLSSHWVERTIMKGVLYPLVGFLAVSSMTFQATRFAPELAALVSGLVASSLIGAFYVGLPFSLIRAKIKRLRSPKREATLEKIIASGVCVGVAGILVGELFTSTAALTFFSSLTVLTTLLLSGTVVSSKIAQAFVTPHNLKP